MADKKTLTPYDKQLIFLKNKLKQGLISKKEYLKKKKELDGKRNDEKRKRMRDRIQSSNAPKEMKESVVPRLVQCIHESAKKNIIDKRTKNNMLSVIYRNNIL